MIALVDQDQVIALVSRFLRGQKLNQARVQFYEAEMWEKWTNLDIGSSGAKRGEENLLREVLLNC